jgi:hypothetical protein
MEEEKTYRNPSVQRRDPFPAFPRYPQNPWGPPSAAWGTEYRRSEMTLLDWIVMSWLLVEGK